MAILAIKYWDDPVLSTVCAKIEDNEFGNELEAFGLSLRETMVARSGYGLAAPQVGTAKRIFVMEFPELQSPAVIVCNPTLKLEGSAVQRREGCLSLPNVFESVVRAEQAVMQYRDTQGALHELYLSAMDARVAQHEFDHLNGIMFFDYLDKREEKDTNGRPFGARMSKQCSKNVLRGWDKQLKLIEAAEKRK